MLHTSLPIITSQLHTILVRERVGERLERNQILQVIDPVEMRDRKRTGHGGEKQILQVIDRAEMKNKCYNLINKCRESLIAQQNHVT